MSQRMALTSQERAAIDLAGPDLVTWWTDASVIESLVTKGFAQRGSTPFRARLLLDGHPGRR